jgi:hypothetical protein
LKHHEAQANAEDGFVDQRVYELQDRRNDMVAQPTLGCQIAPSYNHDEWPYNSDSSSDDDSGEVSVAQEQVLDHPQDLSKAETVKDVEALRPNGPTPLQSGRTRSIRRLPAPQQDSVGFWHWSMVRIDTKGGIQEAHGQ